MRPRFFSHVEGFSDGTLYVAIDDRGAVAHKRNGENPSINHITMACAMEHVAKGRWREIPAGELHTLFEGKLMPDAPATAAELVW